MQYQFNPTTDIRREILEMLPHAAKDRASLEIMELHQLLIVYWNWSNRLVPERIYEVHQSDTLKANLLSEEPEMRLALNQIMARLTLGLSVTPYLSDRILVGYSPFHPKKRKNLSNSSDQPTKKWPRLWPWPTPNSRGR